MVAITGVSVTSARNVFAERSERQCSQDPFYKKTLDAPKAFKNFETSDGIIHLHMHDRTVWCVPDIRVGETIAGIWNRPGTLAISAPGA